MMYPVKTAVCSFDANKAKILNAARNLICYSNKCCFSSKSSVELLPEILRLLDSNKMKHRKHPGVKKIPTIRMPSLLIASIYKLISNANEKNILIAANELNNFLVSRRLPFEPIEINWRIRKILNLNDDYCGLNEVSEEQSKKAERQIKSELGRWKTLEYGRFECLAYMAARMPANYASIFKVFSEIKSQLPEYQPKTFFDFGSGVGSAVWAAQAVWNESLSEYFCVDSSSDMNDVAETLLTDEKSGDKYVKNIFFRQFLPASENIKYDLVVSAFSLLDLPSATDRIRIIDTLWRKTKDILVIIEYGNLAGFYSILDARDYILQVENDVPGDICHNSSQRHIVIPCPHETSCPKAEPGYKKTCGVSVPYQYVFPRHRKIIKKDWISYVVLRKGPKPKDSITWPRLVEPVIKKSKFVICRICCNNGKICELTLSKHKHGRHAYRCARSSTLGDSLPFRGLPENIKDTDKE